MKSNSASLSVLGFLVLVALLVIGILEIQKVYAQSDATSTDPIVSLLDTVTPDDSLRPQVAGASISTSEEVAPATDNVSNGQKAPIPEDNLPPIVIPATPGSNGLVEVQLKCNQSYTGPLYDTPSGHIENTTSSSTVDSIIGEQSWTVCHDARGNVHEFTLTPSEYADLRIRGTPQKSVIEPVDEAALDSFNDPTAIATDMATDTAVPTTGSSDSTTTSITR